MPRSRYARSKLPPKAVDEFELIRRYFVRDSAADDIRAGIVVGIGDDGAVLRPPPGKDLVAVVDTLVEAVHFLEAFDAADLGFRAVAVNLSDIAAMGAEARWMTLALTLRSADEAWLAGFAEGLRAAADPHGVMLVGGDTTSGERIVVTVNVTGFVAAGAAIPRSGARIGDTVYVSGTVGDAAAGLALLKDAVVNSRPASESSHPADEAAVADSTSGSDGSADVAATPYSGSGRSADAAATPYSGSARSADVAATNDSGSEHSDALAATGYLISRFRRPTARLALGRALAGVASAAIDLSDGLYGDLAKLLEASGVGAEIDVGRLPLSQALIDSFDTTTARRFALSGGDDYELCFTASGPIDAEIAGVPVTAIGRVTGAPGIVVTDNGKVVPYQDRGYVHFR